jgi:VWFA-related protein
MGGAKTILWAFGEALKVLLSLALLCGLVGPAASPSFAQSPAGEAPIRVDVDIVNVLCTVSNNRGALVTDLTKDDFLITENGKKREIRYFAQEADLPLTVALLLDVSGSVRNVLAQEREAAGRFFDTVLRPTDQALLVGFSSTVTLWQNFTSSSERLKEALTAIHAVPFRGLPPAGQPFPGTLLYDAVYETASTKLNDLAGRKAMLIVSDGEDNGSTKHIDEAIQAVQASNTIVYGICYQEKYSGCSYLKALAEPTGGRMFETSKKQTLDEIFKIIESELRSQYSIGFAPLNAAHDGKFRRLTVRVRPKGLRVSARRGYYAPLDPEASEAKN